jgi:hypothetical protein
MQGMRGFKVVDCLSKSLCGVCFLILSTFYKAATSYYILHQTSIFKKGIKQTSLGNALNIQVTEYDIFMETAIEVQIVFRGRWACQKCSHSSGLSSPQVEDRLIFIHSLKLPNPI